MSADDPNIYKDNQDEPEFDLLKKDAATGERIAATGQPDLFIWYAATKTANEIHADVKKPAIERAGKPGRFYCVMPVAHINAHIFPAYDGKDVYKILSDGGKVRVYERVKAHSTRPSA